MAGEGVLEVSLDGGPVLANLAPSTPTAGAYAYTTLGAAIAAIAAAGVHDVRLRLRGPLRLAHVGFSGRGSGSADDGTGPGTERQRCRAPSAG